MKKSILLLVVFVLLCSGCKSKKDSNMDNINSNDTTNKSINFKCDALLNASNIGFYTFISNNKLYEYDLEKTFSNNENCKEIELPIDTPHVTGDKLENGTLNNVIWSAGKYKNGNRGFIIDDNYILYEYIGPYETNKIVRIGSSMNDLKSNKINSHFTDFGEIYSENGSLYLYTGELISSEYDFSNIISVNGSLIKTNSAYYILENEIVNQEECNKYADVKCKIMLNVEKVDYMANKYYQISNGIGIHEDKANGDSSIIIIYNNSTYEKI